MTDQAGTAWRCTVCGYIHQGAEPPEWCPVCGSARAEFEPYAEPAPHAAKARAGRWQCLNCNYVHSGPLAPDACPVCGAAKDRFEQAPPGEGATSGAGDAGRVVVVGAGIAGISAVESLRKAAPGAEVTLISKEPDLPYYRLNLTRYLAGEIAEDGLPIHPAQWYDEQNVELLLGEEVAELVLDEGAVALRGGGRVPFDRLILTVGAHPFIPPIAGAARIGVTSLRTAADAQRILELPLPGMKCVSIGGGLLGLETAGALARRGADVTLLEGHGWLMPRQLNRRAGELLQDYVTGAGIRLLAGARVKKLAGDERVGGVLLEDGVTVPADMVIIATGVRPNSYLARRAGLEVNQGIVVDNHLAGSHPAVLAAGDVAEHRGTVYGSWHASQYQGSIAGMNAGGLVTEFGGIPRSNTLKVLGVDLLSIGRFEPEDGSFRVVEQEADGRYYRFVFHDGRLVGAVLLGDTSVSAPVKKAIEGGGDFSGLLIRGPAASDVVHHLREMAGA
jgi:nitrite reductase (NADH) large subunit